jgi:hypothetical protein
MSSATDAVDRLIGAVAHRDVSQIGQCFDVDAQSSQWGVPAIVTGRNDIELMCELLLKTHPQIVVGIAERLSVGDVVVDHEEISGYSHLPAGTVVDKVYVYTVRDGRILSMTGISAHL